MEFTVSDLFFCQQGETCLPRKMREFQLLTSISFAQGPWENRLPGNFQQGKTSLHHGLSSSYLTYSHASRVLVIKGKHQGRPRRAGNVAWIITAPYEDTMLLIQKAKKEAMFAYKINSKGLSKGHKIVCKPFGSPAFVMLSLCIFFMLKAALSMA